MTGTSNDVETLTSKFGRAVRNARAVLFIERAIPRIMPPLYTSGLFLSASWAGLWAPLPVEARMAGVLTFAAALVASPLFAKTKTLLVSKDDALRHLDDKIGDPSRPAQTLGDHLGEGHSPATKALWDLHLTRMWEKWGDQFDAGKPQIDIAARDPYKFRYGVTLALVITAFMASGQHVERITDAFNWTKPPVPEETVKKAAALQVRAWVTPPDNIDMPPLYLNESVRDHTQGGNKLVAHKNSVLTILVSGEERKIQLNGQTAPLKKSIAPRSADQGRTTYQYEIQLSEKDSVVTIENGPKWQFEVTPDNAPDVSVNKVEPNDKNIRALDLTCTAKDDFGITEGEVIITLPGAQPPGATPLPSGKLPPLPIPAPCTPQ